MDNVESFREYLLGHFPTLKLPKGKKYVEFPVYKGILVCCMVKKDGVNVYLYSGGRVPAKEIFDKLNSLGVSGKVLNDKYTITPMPGSRNPNVVRIDLLVPYDNRDLDNDDLREEVLDLYTQLIDLCMPLNPDNPFYDSPTKSVESQSEKIEPVQKDSSQFKQETPNTKKPLSVKSDNFGNTSEQKTKSSTISIRLEGFGQRNELFDISKASIDSESEHNSDYWYDDFSENHAYSDCDEVLSYSLPFYNDNLNISIEGVGISKEIGNESLDEILDLDNTYTKENNDKYESGVGSENTPLILFQFRTKGIYHFESLELPAGEEFDLNRLGVNILKPVVPFEEVEEKGIRKKKWQYMVKGFVYTFLDGTKKHLDFDSGDYKETPLNPNIGTWFQIAETYDDWLSEEEQVIKFFKQFEYKPDDVVTDISEQYDEPDDLDDILRNDDCPGGLLEGLYDENIDYWVDDRDKNDLKYTLGYITEHENAPKTLLKKVLTFREKNILDDEICNHYQDLACDICECLKDYDWGRKIFEKAKEETFKEEVWSEHERYPTSLAFDVCTKLGDKVWGKELFKEAEKYCKDVYFAEKLSRVFASDDPEWCKQAYISNINDQKNQNVQDLCEIGGSIASDGLNDKVMATESFQTAETMVSYLTDYVILAGSVSDKDGLNDKKWSEELFQKGLVLFCSNDYKEHPDVKEYDYSSEFGKISDCIKNDYSFPWEIMKDWLDTINAIDDKLENGASRQDAVIDYLDDEHKEQINHTERESELELKKHNEKKSGTLKIEFGGRMHQSQWGYVSSDLMDELDELSEDFNDYDFPGVINGIEDLISSSWFGVPDELGTYLKEIKSDFPTIASWCGKDWGEIWEDFNIFRFLPVIDNDNALRITLEGEVLFQGTVGQLEVFKGNIYDNSEVLVLDEADDDEAKQMIQFLKNIKLTSPYKLIIQNPDFGGIGKSKDGWLTNTDWIYDSHYKQILEKTDFENRFCATVYGKYHLTSTQKVNDFRMDKIIWYFDSDLWEFGPSGHESYCLSGVFYADTGEIELITDDFNIKDVSVDFSWPTDD